MPAAQVWPVKCIWWWRSPGESCLHADGSSPRRLHGIQLQMLNHRKQMIWEKSLYDENESAVVIWVLPTSPSQTNRFGLVLYLPKLKRKAKAIIVYACVGDYMHPFPAWWLCKSHRGSCPSLPHRRLSASGCSLGTPCPCSVGPIQKQWTSCML